MSGNYNRKDHLYHKAKEEGYQSRAAYKLIELNQKFGLLKPGFFVFDLGCWPGGWLQIAGKAVGVSGKVVGIDLHAVDELGLTNVHTITGDAREEAHIDKALALAGKKFDVLLSDMAPNISGIKEVDRFASLSCAELAIWVAGKVLRPGGNLVIKVFKSNEIDGFVKSSRLLFNKLTRVELESSRSTSNEYYLVGLGWRGQ